MIGGINIPIFAGNRVHADVLEADAQLKQLRAQLGDLRGRIDYEVRTALLDLNAAAEQVEVARSSVELAEQALAQSQDRFYRRGGRQSGSRAGAGSRRRRPRELYSKSLRS